MCITDCWLNSFTYLSYIYILNSNLLKLAFVEEIQEKASNIKETGDLVDKAQETAGGVMDTVSDVNVDSAAEVTNNVVGGREMVEVVGWSEAVPPK